MFYSLSYFARRQRGSKANADNALWVPPAVLGQSLSAVCALPFGRSKGRYADRHNKRTKTCERGTDPEGRTRGANAKISPRKNSITALEEEYRTEKKNLTDNQRARQGKAAPSAS